MHRLSHIAMVSRKSKIRRRAHEAARQAADAKQALLLLTQLPGGHVSTIATAAIHSAPMPFGEGQSRKARKKRRAREAASAAAILGHLLSTQPSAENIAEDSDDESWDVVGEDDQVPTLDEARALVTR